MLSRLIDGCGKQCACYTRRGNACWMLRPKPGCTSASAVVIFAKRESRHDGIACKSMSPPWRLLSFQLFSGSRTDAGRPYIHRAQALVFRGLGAEPSTSFLQFCKNGIACGDANVLHLPCLPPGFYCIYLFEKRQEKDSLYWCNSRKMV